MTIPIRLFHHLSIITFCAPLGSIIILWWISTLVDSNFFSFLLHSFQDSQKFYIYLIIFIFISFFLWNIRLYISESKIYYHFLGFPISWVITRKEISHSQFNKNYDPPYTYIKRKLKHFNTPELEQKFNMHYGTVEFIFIEKSLFNTIRHKFALINLSAFSSEQAMQVMDALQQNWDLNLHN